MHGRREDEATIKQDKHHSTIPPFHHSNIPIFHHSIIPTPWSGATLNKIYLDLHAPLALLESI